MNAKRPGAAPGRGRTRKMKNTARGAPRKGCRARRKRQQKGSYLYV